MVDYNLLIGSSPELLRSAWQSGVYELTANDLSMNAGQSLVFTGGAGWLRNNNLNESDIRKEFRANTGLNILGTAAAGATFGSAFGPWGTAIGAVGGAIVGGVGSIFRSNSLKDKIVEAKNNNYRTNTVNESIALSQAMNNNWNKSFVDTYNLVRYGAEGLDRRSGSINAIMKPEEMIVDGAGNGSIPGGGTPKKDSVGVYVDDNTAILNDYFTAKAMPSLIKQKHLLYLVDKNKGESKNIAQRVVLKSLNDSRNELLAIADEQKLARELGLIPKGDNDMPAHAAKGLDSIAVNGLSGLIGLGLFIGAYGQQVKNPNTYRLNPYAYQAFDTLDRINIPMLPIINLMKDAVAKEHQGIYNSGGLSSSLKLAANVALTSNSQSNIAKSMFDYYRQLNDIKAKTAQLKLGEGQHAALMMLNAAQWDLDYYSKAHAARQDMMNMGIVNTIGSLRLLVADADKRRRWEQMMDLYWQGNSNNTRSETYNNPFNTKKSETGSVASIKNANPGNESVQQVLDLTKQKNTIPYTVPQFNASIKVPTAPIGSNLYYLDKANEAADKLYNRLSLNSSSELPLKSITNTSTIPGIDKLRGLKGVNLNYLMPNLSKAYEKPFMSQYGNWGNDFNNLWSRTLKLKGLL